MNGALDDVIRRSGKCDVTTLPIRQIRSEVFEFFFDVAKSNAVDIAVAGSKLEDDDEREKLDGGEAAQTIDIPPEVKVKIWVLRRLWLLRTENEVVSALLSQKAYFATLLVVDVEHNQLILRLECFRL